jgi:hypothetical protein
MRHFVQVCVLRDVSQFVFEWHFRTLRRNGRVTGREVEVDAEENQHETDQNPQNDPSQHFFSLLAEETLELLARLNGSWA